MTDERRLGLAVLDCDGDGGACPGLLDGTVVNAPGDGCPPRGFFIRPRGHDLGEVEVVIIGQNPGAAGGFERHLNRLAISREDRFDIMTAAVVAAMRDEPYYVALDVLLRNLWPDGRERVVLATEVAYCESRRVPEPKRPGKLRPVALGGAVPFCTERHLEHQLALVSTDATVICNGKIAATWFRDWAEGTGFKGLWMAVDHSSGSRKFKGLFKKGEFKPSVQANWERLKRERTPLHLGTGAHLRRPEG